ncbi:hypothetical protein JD844_023667, partial [Phrynosoma platyrhinos]
KLDTFICCHFVFYLIFQEDKENVNGSMWNRINSTLGENIVSPKALKSPTVLKQIGTATNCNSPSSTTAVSDPTENKNKGISFSKTFLLNRNAKEKQLKTTTPSSGACLSEKRVLGSYRGRIVSSKINSFRKIQENEGNRNSLAVPPKSVVRTGSTDSSKCTRDPRITNTAGASKPESVTLLQSRPAVRVSVSHPKPILSHEKQSVSSALVHKGGAQLNPVRNLKPVLKAVPPNANNSAHRTKKLSVSKAVRESLAGPLSEHRSTLSASKSFDNRNSLLARSSDVRRSQLAEWQSWKGVKKPPAPISANTQPEIETIGQTAKEPAKSFWAAIAEEDEQGLFSDGVNNTLAECLSLIEKGYPGEAVHSTLEKLILQVPDAKKLAKYWVCQMRLEQFRSTEKVLGIYESAILAGAQPKNELRHALADVMKATTSLRKSEANDSAVKDLKFLTPVRRSRRINEKRSKLPKELKEHNLCVSSLEELGELGDDGIGFIYRQNSALQKVYPQELPKE